MKHLITIVCLGCWLTAVIAKAEPPTDITLENFNLAGNLTNAEATFTLSATARVDNSRGGTLEIVSGPIALIEFNHDPKWRLRTEDNRLLITFDRRGSYPIRLTFAAAVQHNENIHSLSFHVASSSIQPLILEGLSPDTELTLAGAARPERSGRQFQTHVPPDGAVHLSWKEARAEGEGKLFYAVEMLSQISVSPGLMRQVGLLDFKVMQGELSRVALLVHGAGEVTRVQGDQVLAWNLEPVAGSADRRLMIGLNQPQKDQVRLLVQLQTPLGAFPQKAEPMQLRPEGATRFAGYLRVVNEGAVSLEVTQSAGLSQVSPEQFPESDATRAALALTGNQRFAYRFSGADYALAVQADQILPEIGVSELLAYRLAETELAIDAEIELEIRDAPLRELLLHVPKGYAVARLSAAGLADYFVHEPEGQPDTELRLVFGQPVTGREVVELHLEHNKALGQNTWELPRVEVVKAKSIRGHIAVAADAGFRLTSERTQALTEISAAFFPKKLPGIQAAFRLTDPNWQAALHVERLPQSIQADALHLFSVGEGIAYGSSLINYTVSGAPVSQFRIELSDEYFNVEFAGKDIRNWQKTGTGYLVQLHTPVSGPYTLLATYERPFKTQGETLGFTGARPLDVQSEQGHTLIISAYQFQVKPVDVSAGLLPLETAEVPAEYRLFFDAPILAAYRYHARPFNLKLSLTPLAQGDSLSQVVDRGLLTTRISKEGQVVTSVRYFVKNRGHPHLKLRLPADTQLWSAAVNGLSVVPVTDSGANLIPLPPGNDPNAVLTVDLKLASRSKNAHRLSLAAPMVEAPVMLAEWKFEPDTGQRLVYRGGLLTPEGNAGDGSGFAQLARVFAGDQATQARANAGLLLFLLSVGLLVCLWASVSGVHRFGTRHIGGLLTGTLAFSLGIFVFLQLTENTQSQKISLPREVSFLVPVQQAGAPLSVEVANLPEKMSLLDLLLKAWPGLIAIPVWFGGWIAQRRSIKRVGAAMGCALLSWAALRCPNGAIAFLWIVFGCLVLQGIVPVVIRLLRVPPAPARGPANAAGGAAPAAAASLLIGLIWLGTTNSAFAASDKRVHQQLGVADSVAQQVRVTDNFISGKVKIEWTAERGQTLPVLLEPAALISVHYTPDALKLIQATVGGSDVEVVSATNQVRVQEFQARKNGRFDIELEYSLPITKRDSDSGFFLPTRSGLVNRLELTMENLDVDVVSLRAVSIERTTSGTNTLATLVLAPAGDNWIGWRPRSRDLKRERPVFYAELTQLYVPSAGIIEGAHRITIRPAQGELSELIFTVPTEVSITDVTDSAGPTQTANGKSEAAPLVSLWRFDPDIRRLRVTLNRPQSRPFSLLVRSQCATGPLPLDHSIGLLGIEDAAGQLGLVGIATGNEVQLDAAAAPSLSPLNLEDFPSDLLASLQSRFAGLTLRRAFRYSDRSSILLLKASAVEPDVRVETQTTLSLGEDRTVLATTAAVAITRAGIFRLSFLLPAGFDVESISGSALSHWTELNNETGRVVTLHLNGKTEGQQQFLITLAGTGVRATNGWSAPQIVLNEAGKQQGTLLLVPEQGLRLQVAAAEGLTQLDPQKSGIKQKGVLGFRILQNPSTLRLNIEQVEPWVQVNSLQQATVTEAQLKVDANLQYQIENTGLKAFRVLLPTNAESVRFQGEQIVDFRAVPNSVTNDLQIWEVKLQRRVIGSYLLQVGYQSPLANGPETRVRGLQALDVNLQRGFVTIRSAGRLQVRVDSPPATLQPAEWQSIPRVLQHGLPEGTADLSYRLVETGFDLALRVERHQATRLLEARVNNISLESAVSEEGAMLTQVRLELQPGDKRLLNVTLPKQGEFWFAFVNQNGVWPWREQDRILIPLEQQGHGEKPILVEFFYSCPVHKDASPSDLELLAPKFDLPLENITWNISLNEKWRIKNWAGSLQLQQESLVRPATAIDFQNYLQSEALQQQDRTKQAEQFLAAANSALAQGEPQQARRAFQAAYGLSAHDAAFNEDARVQLHNIKLQEALVGLNMRQAGSGAETGTLGAKFRDLRNRKEVSYTQQDAKDIIDWNSAEDNAAFMRLAERLVQQQDAVVTTPAALRASIPEQGRLLTFKRAVAVDPWADLRIELKTSLVRTSSPTLKVLLLIGTFALLALFGWAGRARWSAAS